MTILTWPYYESKKNTEIQLPESPSQPIDTRRCKSAGCDNEIPPRRQKCDDCKAKTRKEWLENKPVDMRVYTLAQYGLSVDEYERMNADQQGRCLICGTHERELNKGRLAVDHDHATGYIRGLLCHRCNPGLGHFKDDIELLKKAISYLEKANAEQNIP